MLAALIITFNLGPVLCGFYFCYSSYQINKKYDEELRHFLAIKEELNDANGQCHITDIVGLFDKAKVYTKQAE